MESRPQAGSESFRRPINQVLSPVPAPGSGSNSLPASKDQLPHVRVPAHSSPSRAHAEAPCNRQRFDKAQVFNPLPMTPPPHKARVGQGEPRGAPTCQEVAASYRTPSSPRASGAFSSIRGRNAGPTERTKVNWDREDRLAPPPPLPGLTHPWQTVFLATSPWEIYPGS